MIGVTMRSRQHGGAATGFAFTVRTVYTVSPKIFAMSSKVNMPPSARNWTPTRSLQTRCDRALNVDFRMVRPWIVKPRGGNHPRVANAMMTFRPDRVPADRRGPQSQGSQMVALTGRNMYQRIKTDRGIHHFILGQPGLGGCRNRGDGIFNPFGPVIGLD